MEWIDQLLQQIMVFLSAKFPITSLITMVLGSIMLAAQVIVQITPSKKDDAVLDKIKSKPWLKIVWDFFLSFAVFQKKDGAVKLSKD